MSFLQSGQTMALPALTGSSSPVVLSMLESEQNKEHPIQSPLLNSGFEVIHDDRPLRMPVIGGRFAIKEVPELIFVETRFITQVMAAQYQVSASSLVEPFDLTEEEIQAPKYQPTTSKSVTNQQSSNHLTTSQPTNSQTAMHHPIMNQLSTNKSTTRSTPLRAAPNDLSVGILAKTKTVEAGVETEDYPMRHRGVQIEMARPPHVDVGIQCNLDAGYFEQDFDAANNTIDEDSDGTDKEQFLQFCNGKASQHNNGKSECLICGEVMKSTKGIENHMVIHWQQHPVLCTHCGERFGNDILHRQHICEMKPERWHKQYLSGILKCPHYGCKVSAISLLELYDHLNEHVTLHLYRCSGCKRKYKTATELRRHISVRPQCGHVKFREMVPYTNLNARRQRFCRVRIFSGYSMKKKGVLFKSFLSQKRIFKKSLKCSICLKVCTNPFQYKMHSSRCVRSYFNRLIRKRYGPRFTNEPML